MRPCQPRKLPGRNFCALSDTSAVDTLPRHATPYLTARERGDRITGEVSLLPDRPLRLLIKTNNASHLASHLCTICQNIERFEHYILLSSHYTSSLWCNFAHLMHRPSEHRRPFRFGPNVSPFTPWRPSFSSPDCPNVPTPIDEIHQAAVDQMRLQTPLSIGRRIRSLTARPTAVYAHHGGATTLSDDAASFRCYSDSRILL